MPTALDYIQRGNLAVRLLEEGRFAATEDVYLTILAKLRTESEPDPRWIARATLGLLLAAVQQRAFERALAVWKADAADSVFGAGVDLLERNATEDPRDAVL